MKASTHYTLKKTIFLIVFALINCFTYNIYAQTNADPITSGVSFQWSDTQSAPADPATLQSITVNGTVYDRLGIPTGYELTQLGPNGHSKNRVRLNGAFLIQTSITAGDMPTSAWDDAALLAFSTKNLNHYFEASGNGQNICNNYTAADGAPNEDTTTAQRQILTYSPGIEVGVNTLLAITERNANNCYHVEVFGTPAGGGATISLGQTFVNQSNAQWGYGGTGTNSSFGTTGAVTPPPTPQTATSSDFWLADRVIDNYGAIGIALFNLDDLAPIGSTITSVQLTAGNNDHGDGKVFIMSFLDEDGDGVDDALDLDNDNDGILDADEGCGNDIDIIGNFGIGGIDNSDDGPTTLTGTTATYDFTENGSDITVVNANGAGQQGPLFRFEGDNNDDSTIDITFSPNIYAPIFKITDFDNEEIVKVTLYDENNNVINITGLTNIIVGAQVIQSGTNGEVFTEIDSNNNVEGDDVADDPLGGVLFNMLGYTVSRITVNVEHTATSSIRFTEITYCQGDTDGDGIPDYLDTDSDNDGCPDALEGDSNILATQLNADGSINNPTNDNGIPVGPGTAGNGTTGQGAGTSTDNNAFDSFGQCDSDGDGVIDVNDICNGFDDAADNDVDGVPDGCDDDDDNDGISDINEGLVTTSAQPACGAETVLNFNNPFTEESGDGNVATLLEGETFRFPGVAPGIDALVTIVDFVNITSLPELDNNASNPNSFKPQSSFLLIDSGDQAYTEFQFEFVVAGTSTPNPIATFFVNFNDVDGNTSYAEQNWSQTPTSYVVDNPTDLLITNPDQWIVGTGGFIEHLGSTNTNPQANYATEHGGTASFTIRLGAVARVDGATATAREHNVEFNCITNFVSPQSTSVVDTDGDGTPDHQDTDSDNDGCSDANEAYNNGATDAADGEQFGAGDPLTLGEGEVNADGTVVGASYGTGVVAAVTDAGVSSGCSTELTVTKTPTGTTAAGAAGDVDDVIAYDIVVTNSGNTILTDIDVVDANADAGSIMGSPIASLAPGASVTVTATQTITQADIDAGYIENSATATGDGPSGTDDVTDDSDTNVDGNGDPITDNETTESEDGDGTTDGDTTNDPTVTTFTPDPELTVTKTPTGTTAAGAAGDVDDVIAYDIVVTNTGNVTVTDIDVVDANADAGSIMGSPIASLAPGASVTVTATQTITQADIDAGYIENSATATGDGPSGTDDVTDDSDTNVDGNGDPITDNETTESEDGDGTTDGDTTNDPTVTTFTPDPELTVTKTPTGTTAAGAAGDVDDVIAYDIVVTNTGNVTVTDIDVVDANADAGSIMGSPIASLAPGASVTVTATQTITQADIDAGYIENSATATGDGPSGTDDVTDDSDTNVDGNGDPITDNETTESEDGDGTTDGDTTNDPTVTTFTPDPELTVTKTPTGTTAAGAAGDVDDVIAYDIVVTNTGNVTVTDIDVVDANADAGSIMGSPIASLAPGASVTVTATQTITQADIDAGYIENSATATGDGPSGTDDVTDDSDTNVDGNGDPITDNETTESEDGDGTTDGDTTNDPTVTTFTPDPELTVTKTPTGTTAAGAAGDVDDVIAYDIVVTNTGNVTVTDIDVVDANADAGSIMGSPIASLAPGASVTVTATQTITQADIDAGYIENSATATGDGPSGTDDVTDDSDTNVDGNGDPITDNETTESEDGDGTTDGDTTNDPTVTTFTPDPELTVTKTPTGTTAAGAAGDVDDVIAYDIVVTNTGNVTVTDIDVVDANADAGSIMGSPIASLAPGASVTVTATQTITQADIDAGYIENSATATGDGPSGTDDVTDDSDTNVDGNGDPITDNETTESEDGDGTTDGDTTNDPTVTTFTPDPELTVTKTPTGTTAAGAAGDVDDVIAYDIVVTNTGNVTVTDIDVVDANADAGSIMGSPIASLAPGASVTVTATQTITQADIDAGYIENSATATGDGPSGTDDVTDDSDTNVDGNGDPITDNETTESEDGDGTTDGDTTNDPTVTTFTPDPELTVTKTPTGTTAAGAAGDVDDVIAYDIVVTNTGNVTVTDIDVVDANADAGSIMGSPIASLAPGASVTVTATQTITQADIDAGYIENSATATGDGPSGTDDVTDDSDTNVDGNGDPITDNETTESEDGDGTTDGDTTNDPTVTTFTPDPELTVTKTPTGTTAAGAAGDVDDVIAYDIVVTNTGNVTVTDIDVVDANADAGSIMGSPIASLAPGASVTVTATQTITQADIDAGYIENSATATGDGPSGTDDVTDDSDTNVDGNGDPITDNETTESEDGDGTTDGDTTNDPTVTTFTPDPELTVTKTPTGTTAAGAAGDVDDVIAYDIVVTNTGNVTVTDIDVVDANADAGSIMGSPIASLAPGASVTVTATQTITQADIDAGYIENSATATGDGPSGTDDVTDDSDTNVDGNGDPITDNETTESEDGDGTTDGDTTNDPTVTTFTPDPELTVTKTPTGTTAAGAAGDVDDVIAYDIVVTNTGNVTVTDIDVVDANADAGSIMGSPIASLAPGASVTVTATQTITQADIDAGYIENSATATGDGPSGTDDVTDDSDTNVDGNGDPITDNETTESEDGDGTTDGDTTNDPTVTTFTPDPELTVTKTPTGTTAAGAAGDVDDVIAYDIVVTNTGNVTVTDIDVVDANADAGSIMGSPIASLAPGASVTVTATQTITQADIDAGYIENSATATGDGPSGTDDVTDDSDTNVDGNGDPITDNETTESEDGDGTTDGDTTNDPTVTTFTPDPELTVTKTPTGTTAAGAAGDVDDVIAYDIVVTNTGNVTVTDIDVVDANADAGSIMGSPIASLAPGASVTVTATQTITQADIDAGYIENSATATGDGPSGTDDVTDDSDTNVDGNGDPITDNETTESEDGDGTTDGDTTNDPTVTTFTPDPELTVTKTPTGTTAAGAAGDVDDVIAYDIVVTNTGNVTVTDIDVVDANADAGSIMGSPIASLAPGASVTVTATQTITQADIDAGYIENSATATGDGPSGTDDVTDDSDTNVDGNGDPITDNETTESEDGDGTTDGDTTNDPTVTTFTPDPELTVTKTPTGTTAAGAAGDVDDVIAYDIVVTNTGNVTVTDIDVVDANADAGSIMGSPIASLAPGASVTVTATQTITQADIDAGYIENSATATGDGPSGTDDVTDDSDTNVDGNGDPITDNETTESEDGDGTTDGDTTNDPTVTTFTPDPELTVTKTPTGTTAAGAAGDVDDVIAYDIVVTNTGNVTVTDIDVVDANADAGSIMGSPIASLAPGASVTVTATQTITQADIDAGYIENSATATGDGPSGTDDVTDDSDTNVDGNGDPITDNETTESEDGDGTTDGDTTNDPTVTTFTPDPELTVTKTPTGTTAAGAAGDVDDVIAYDIVVTNTGNVTVTDIDVVDANADAGSIMGSPIASLAPGASVTVTATQTITQADIDAGYIENSATATGDGPSGTDDVTDDSDTNVDGNGDPITDNETTESEDGDGTTDGDTTNDPTVTTFTPDPELTVTKTPTGTTAAGAAGDVDDVIAYDIVVTNTGNVTVTDIDVVDANADAGSIMGSPIASLAPGASVTVTATQTITQADIDAGYIENSATATGDGPSGTDDVTDDSDTNVDGNGDPITDNETTESEDGDGTTDGDTTNDPTVTTFTPDPELTVTKTPTGTTAAGAAGDVDDVIAYDIVVTNTGNVTVTDIDVVDANADAGSIMGSPIASLAPGASVTVTATQTITQADIDAGYIENSATATGDGPSGTDDVTDDSDTNVDGNGDPITDNETTESEDGDGTTDGDTTNDPTVTTFTPDPELTVTKTPTGTTAAGAAGDVDDVIAYDIVVTNTGNVTVTDIDVVDANADAGSIMGSPIASLAPGASVTVTATQTITQADIDAGYIENSATATGDGPSGTDDVTDDSDTNVDGNGDPITDNETTESEDGDGTTDGDTTNDPTVTNLNSTSDLILTKTASVGGAGGLLGDVITYTFTVTNTGVQTITDVTIDDALTGSVDLPVTPDTLIPGAVGTATATYTITQDDIDRGYVENSATVTGQDPDGNNVTDVSDTGSETVETPDGDGMTDGDSTNDPTLVITIPDDEEIEVFDFISLDDGDNDNDSFVISGLQNFPDNNVKIYNRWGVLVYEKSQYHIGEGFKGVSNGRVTIQQEKKLPAGVYYYVLTYVDNGIGKSEAGPLYIKR